VILVKTGSGLTLFAKIGHQQEQSRQTLLTGIEQLIDQVSFHARIPLEQMRDEQLRKRRLLVKHALHGGCLEAHDLKVVHGRRCSEPKRLTVETTFAKEFPFFV
jgi:hypothetical protein